MKDADKVAAAVQIVSAMRNALAQATEDHQKTGWDAEALTVEMTRLLGFVYRAEDVTPTRLDDLVRLLRTVYAGMQSPYAMTVEQAIEHFCAEQNADPSGSMQGDLPSGRTVH